MEKGCNRQSYVESEQLTLEPKINTIDNSNHDIAQHLNEDSRMLTSLPPDIQKLESVEGSLLNQLNMNPYFNQMLN